MQSPDDPTPEPETLETPEPEAEEPETPEEKPEEPAADAESKAEEGEETEGEEKPEGEEAKAPEASGGEEKRKRTGGWQRKIDRQERQIQILTEQLQRQGQAPPPEAKPEKDKTPEEKAADYFRAAAKQALAEERQQQRQQTVVADFQRRTAEVRAAHEDFDDVVPGVNIPAESALGQVLLTSPHGPDIMYQLAKSPAELARLSALPALDAAREVGRLEAELSSLTPPAKTTSTLTAKRPPAPPTSVKGSAASTRSIENLEMSEYKSAYRAGKR